MINFIIRETVITELTVKNNAGNLYDPSTSVKITITDILGTVIIDGENMTKASVGKYQHDFDSDDYVEGTYLVVCEMLDGSRLKIERGTFNLVR